MSSAPVILWFRRDLRLTDHSALNAALKTGSPVIPVFVFDPTILKNGQTGAPRVAFLLKALQSLDQSLRACGGGLVIQYGNPVAVLPKLAEELGAVALYFNRDYSPYALRRDRAVEAAVSVPVFGFEDSLLVAPGEMMNNEGAAYTVFTPFKKKWLNIPKALPDDNRLRPHQLAFRQEESIGKFTLKELGFAATIDVPDASENEAQQRLSRFVSNAIYDYEDGRNRLAADPENDPIPGTSFLSAYLHLGLLSIREAYWSAESLREDAPDDQAQKGLETWIGELAWRDFYQHILFHFPHVTTGNFRREYDGLEWRSAPEDLQAWKEGKTGYPIVDAAMRQLRQTGWIPNRARMIVASFLTKDLLIDWREGEAHFMRWLIDGDLAANNGGWQWAAGTGTDAQPYFRVFSPISQAWKFDPAGAYVRRWIPELKDVPTEFIHTPHDMPQPPNDYPPPIVDHQFARRRALEIYKVVKRSDLMLDQEYSSEI